MAKKQTRRSISVSRVTYERLKAFCETNHVSMSQLVETRVNDFLGSSGVAADPGDGAPAMMPQAPMRPIAPMAPRAAPVFRPIERSVATEPVAPRAAPVAAPSPSGAPPAARPAAAPPAAAAPMTSAAARFAVEPPPPIIKPRPVDHEPKAPAEPTPGQIFTF